MTRTVGANDISPQTRVAVVVFLTTLSKEGRLRYGTIARAKRLFKLSRASVETTWGLRNDSAALVQPRRPYPPKKTRLSAKEVGERVAAVPLCQRQTLRALEAASGIPRSTLHRHLKSKVLRRFISRVKPTLTDGHKLQRLTWVLAHVQRPIGKNLDFSL
ncbi:uncharacterized protein IUM83_17452 [Phytophthora cinnamomi]|uniref:uncharacterized protein n=1 Tax=Phytophthora cinnamomi TaxID=4785 RepID=UPI00355A2036|nr:hypothetical protein IUM83_17452 [Phytophthora cinnamomi]